MAGGARGEGRKLGRSCARCALSLALSPGAALALALGWNNGGRTNPGSDHLGVCLREQPGRAAGVQPRGRVCGVSLSLHGDS